MGGGDGCGRRQFERALGMKVVDIPGGQGSPAWHAHRAKHWNASDAPAMMGCSPHESRNELLHRLFTGIPREHDEATKRLFAEGHRAEALARPLAEEVIGEELYAITVTEGPQSASLDGTVLTGEVNWEHKLLNAELEEFFAQPRSHERGQELPLHYRVQMEQQFHCSVAEKCLFTASSWTPDGRLIKARHCWYAPDLALRQRILDGWAQFERDLAAYVPPEPRAPVVAEVVETLPAAFIRLDGNLVVNSNLQPLAKRLKDFIEQVPKRPETDNEFATCVAAVKALKKAEDALAVAEAGALASIPDVEAMRRTVAECLAMARAARLATSMLVDARKDQIRADEVRRGNDAISRHVAGLHPLHPGVMGSFGEAIRGLKTIESLRNAIDTEIARCKIEADRIDRIVTANAARIEAAGREYLFIDRARLVTMDPEALAAVVQQRCADDQARLDAAANLKEAAAALAPSVSKPEPAAAPVDTSKVMRLGEIAERLQFSLTEEFLLKLGFQPCGNIRRAVLYQRSDWAAIKAALIKHIEQA